MNDELLRQIGYFGAYGALAVLATIGGFAWARQRRMAAICAEFGHEWSEGFTGLECSRCFKHSWQE